MGRPKGCDCSKRGEGVYHAPGVACRMAAEGGVS